MEDVQVGDIVEYPVGKSIRAGRVTHINKETLTIEHYPIPFLDVELVPVAYVHKSKITRKVDA